jgi:hypothetical protein
METDVNVADISAANETVVAETPVVETVEAPAPSIDEDLRSVWDKHNPARDETGKFLSKNPPAETPAEPNADRTAETVIEQAKPAIDAPISWSAEQKAKFSTLPPDLQGYIAQRDKESHDAITRAGQQIKAFEPIGEVIKQYSDSFQRNGLQPHDAFARMMEVERMLDRNPRAAIEQIAKAYGVDLGQNEQPATPESAELAELRAKVATFESKLTEQERARENEVQTKLSREIADFAKDKPHFEAVRHIMAGLMQSGAAETMQDAYEKATYADPIIRQSILADQHKAEEAKRKEEEAKRVAAAKKAGGVNVKSSPGAAPAAKSNDAELWEIARRHYGT